MTYKNEPKISVGYFCFPTDNGIWSRFFWFLIYDFWMASKQAITLAFVWWWFFGYFHLKKWGAQPKFCLTIRFLALKPCLAFMVKKTISSNAYYFLVLFLVVSHWFFWSYNFPSFFFVGLWLLNFFRMLLTFFLEMFYKKHNIFFVGRGKKGSLDFLKKQFYF